MLFFEGSSINSKNYGLKEVKYSAFTSVARVTNV